MKKIAIQLVLLVTLIFCLVGCSNKTTTTQDDGTIKPLDYSNDENWLIKRYVNDAEYDVIFFYGTGIKEPTYENGVGEISEAMKIAGKSNFISVGSQLTYVKSSKNNEHKANVFIPLYRQMALYYALSNYTMHNDIINDDREKGPYADIKNALDYYFTVLNKDATRPFVLAGHSQGSAMLQVVLEEYFIEGGHKEYLKKMVAAYSTGYGVSKKWFDGLDKKLGGEEVIHFATGALDYNCLISWNAEGPNPTGKNFLLSDDEYDTYVINPLNWKTDETQATIAENFGVLINNPNKDENDPLSTDYIVSTDESELFDAKIDLRRGSVVCSEGMGTYVYLPPYGAIWGAQSLHLSDGPAFYVNMARNLGDRLDAYLGK